MQLTRPGHSAPKPALPPVRVSGSGVKAGDVTERSLSPSRSTLGAPCYEASALGS